MAEKLGNGGHGYENYDPETGKYIEDGIANKYYSQYKGKPISEWTPEDVENFKKKVLERKNNKNKEQQNKEFSEKRIEDMSQQEINLEIRKMFPIISSLFNLPKDSSSTTILGTPEMTLSNFRAMHKLQKQFPISQKINIKLNGRLGTRTWGQAWPRLGFETKSERDGSKTIFIDKDMDSIIPRAQNIDLNKNNMNASSKDVYAHLLKNENSGWNSKSDSSIENVLSSTLRHEYGHNLCYNVIGDLLIKDFSYKEKQKSYIEAIKGKTIVKGREGWGTVVFSLNRLINDNGSYESYFNYYLQDVRRQIMDIGKKDNPDYNFENDTSTYGRTGYSSKQYQEWFAETFSSLTGGNPTPTAKAMGKWLKMNGYYKGDEKYDN